MIRKPEQVSEHRRGRGMVHEGTAGPASLGGEGSAAMHFDAYRRGTADIQRYIGRAIQAGEPVRARGRGWSLSGVGMTPRRPVEARGRSLGVYRLLEDDILPRQGPDRLLCFVEGGLQIGQVHDELSAMGLSLKTTGSNNGQTLAGAISTGTHGSAFRFGAMQDFVAGLHLIVGPNRHIYLEPATAPAVTEAFVDRLGAELVRDDTLFNAALVGFGAFGVIQGVTIETRERFILHAYRRKHAHDEALRCALASLDFSQLGMPDGHGRDALHHFGAMFSPGSVASPESAWLDLMFEAAVPSDYEPPTSEELAVGPGVGTFEIMADVFRSVPAPLATASRAKANHLVDQHLRDCYEVSLPRDLFRGRGDAQGVLAVDMGMPLDRALDALGVAFRAHRRVGSVMPLLFACRYVRGTQALLGFTQFDPTCVLEVYTGDTAAARRFIRALWADLNIAGIPFTLHWGKWMGYLSPRRVREMYGDACEQWVTARAELLEDDATRRAFTNPFLQHAGLV